MKKMNEHESLINKPYLQFALPVSIPGLHKDYKDIKRDEMLDNFLMNQKKTLTFNPNSY